MAELTRQPLSRVVGHMRALREAEPSLVTNKGRGITAPPMTTDDAAALLCAIFAAPNIQESASAIVDLRKLPPKAQGRSRSDRASWMHDRYLPRIDLKLSHDHTVIDGLAAAIGFFMEEDEFRREWHQHGAEPEVYARFVVRAPEYSASLSVGVRGHFSEEWIYGRTGELDAFRTGQCTEITLRKLAACLKD
jgi:hypothetical protein